MASADWLVLLCVCSKHTRKSCGIPIYQSRS